MMTGASLVWTMEARRSRTDGPRASRPQAGQRPAVLLLRHLLGVSPQSYAIAPKWAATSTMRFEKPHSLSYQDSTRTKVLSSTWVWVTSKVELCESWLKSTDTVAALLMPTMPRKRFDLAASSINEFTSSAVVSRLASNLKSISDTFGVGTRIAVPSSLPLSAGSTSPTARAAPVEVGIKDRAAARARRR